MSDTISASPSIPEAAFSANSPYLHSERPGLSDTTDQGWREAMDTSDESKLQTDLLDGLASLDGATDLSPRERSWVPRIVWRLLYAGKQFKENQRIALQDRGIQAVTLSEYIHQEQNRETRVALERLASLAKDYPPIGDLSINQYRKLRKRVFCHILTHMPRPSLSVAFFDHEKQSYSIQQVMWKSSPGNPAQLSSETSYPSVADKVGHPDMELQNINLGSLRLLASTGEIQESLLVRSGKPDTASRVEQILILQAQEMLRLPEHSRRGLLCVDSGASHPEQIPTYSFRGSIISHLTSSRTVARVSEEDEYTMLKEVTQAISRVAGKTIRMHLPLASEDGEEKEILLRIERPRFLHARWNWTLDLAGAIGGKESSYRLGWQGLQGLYLDALLALYESLAESAIPLEKLDSIAQVHENFARLQARFQSEIDVESCDPYLLKRNEAFWDSKELKVYHASLQEACAQVRALLDSEENALPDAAALLIRSLCTLVLDRSKLSAAQTFLYRWYMNQSTGALNSAMGAPFAISCKSGDDRTISVEALALAARQFELQHGFPYEPLTHDKDADLHEQFCELYFNYVMKFGYEQSICSKGKELPLIRWGGSWISINRCAREYLPSSLGSKLLSLLFDH